MFLQWAENISEGLQKKSLIDAVELAWRCNEVTFSCSIF